MTSRALAIVLLLAACAPWAHAAGALHHLVIAQEYPILDHGRCMTPMGRPSGFYATPVDAAGVRVAWPPGAAVRWSLDAGGVGSVTGRTGTAYATYVSPDFGNATLRATLIGTAITGTVPVGAYNQSFRSFSMILRSGFDREPFPAGVTTYLRPDRPLDQYGQVIFLPLPPVTWTVEPAGRATVDAQGGLAAGRIVGDITVTGRVGEVVVSFPGRIYAPVPTRIDLSSAEFLPIRPSGTRAFTAHAVDQLGLSLLPQPAFAWRVASGGGSIDGTGLYRAPATDTTATVTASALGVTSAPRSVLVVSPQAVFLGFDTTTQGDWVTKTPYGYRPIIGREGRFIASNNEWAPPCAPTSYRELSRRTALVDRGLVTERRGLAVASHAETTVVQRRLAYFQSSTAFTFPLDLVDDRSHQVSYYLVDWDRLGARHRIEILHPGTGAVLDSREIANFANGVYVRFALRGRVLVRFTPLTTAPVQVHGAFYDVVGGSG